MASGSYWQSYVQCPYYKYDDGRKHIHCEGITDVTQLRISFTTRADFEKYIQKFCCGWYWDCQLCRTIESTYEGVYDDDN